MRTVRTNALQFLVGFVAVAVALPGIVMGIEATLLSPSPEPPPASVTADAHMPAESGCPAGGCDARDPALTHPDTIDDPARPARSKPTKAERERPRRKAERTERERERLDETVENDEPDEPAVRRAVALDVGVPELDTRRAIGKLEELVESTDPTAELIGEIEDLARPVVELQPAPDCAETVPDQGDGTQDETANDAEDPNADAVLALLCALAAPTEPDDATLPAQPTEEAPALPVQELLADPVTTALIAAAASSR